MALGAVDCPAEIYSTTFLPCRMANFQGCGATHPGYVHKLLGNFSATLGVFGNFQLAEQLSMHRATSKFLCLYSHSHAPATSETKKCRI